MSPVGRWRDGLFRSAIITIITIIAIGGAIVVVLVSLITGG